MFHNDVLIYFNWQTDWRQNLIMFKLVLLIFGHQTVYYFHCQFYTTPLNWTRVIQIACNSNLQSNCNYSSDKKTDVWYDQREENIGYGFDATGTEGSRMQFLLTIRNQFWFSQVQYSGSKMLDTHTRYRACNERQRSRLSICVSLTLPCPQE